MSSHLKHKDFVGSVHYSAEDDILYGKILGINDLITYEGNSLSQIKKEFKIAVEEYIELCEKLKRPLHKSFKGSFNVRIKPEIHKEAVFYAFENDISLNQVVQDAIISYLPKSK